MARRRRRRGAAAEGAAGPGPFDVRAALMLTLALAWAASVGWGLSQRPGTWSRLASDGAGAQAAAAMAVLLPPAILALGLDRARAARELRRQIAALRRKLDAARRDAGRRAAAVARTAPPPPPEGPALPPSAVLAALALPTSPDDGAGFDALRRGLADAAAGPTLAAANAVMTLLARDGLRPDDLALERAVPDDWRALASGDAPDAPLGSAHPEAAVALARRRLAADADFADAAERFLLAFDRLVAEAAPVWDDAALAGLSGTRTAGLFGLIGRAAGLFEPPEDADAPAVR